MTAPLLGASTLAQMRALQEANMPSACDLIAFVNTRAPGGVTTRTPIVIATVPCRVSLLASSLVALAEQFTPEAQYVITLPALTDTTGIERVNVRGTTDGAAWAVELVVAGIDEPRSFSASRRLRATLATDATGETTDVGTVIVVPA